VSFSLSEFRRLEGRPKRAVMRELLQLGRREFVANRRFGKGLKGAFRNVYRVLLWRVASEGVKEKADTPEKIWFFAVPEGLRTSMTKPESERECVRGGKEREATWRQEE